VEVPELSFRVAGAVLADAVRLIDRFADDHGAGRDAARVVRVGVIDRDHRHAGDRAERARRPIFAPGRVQHDDLIPGPYLGVEHVPVRVCLEAGRGESVDADDVVVGGGYVVVDEQARGAADHGVGHGHLLKRGEQWPGRRVVFDVEGSRQVGQAAAQPRGRRRGLPGVGEVPSYGPRQLPFGVLEHGRDLVEREAQATQQRDPVQAGDVGGRVQPVPGGGSHRGTEQADVVVVV
jgi:hypothetical protein